MECKLEVVMSGAGEPAQGHQLLEEENAALLREMQCLNAQAPSSYQYSSDDLMAGT